MKKLIMVILSLLLVCVCNSSFAHEAGPQSPYSVFDETAVPTVNDDIGDGFTPGSLWFDVSGDLGYVCIDETKGAAVWHEASDESHARYTFIDGTRPFTGPQSHGDNDITNVADISLKTISSDDNTDISVNLGTDAGDDFIVGNNSALVVEGDTDRVGIGTATPASDLDLDGNQRITGRLGIGVVPILNIDLAIDRTSSDTSVSQSSILSVLTQDTATPFSVIGAGTTAKTTHSTGTTSLVAGYFGGAEVGGVGAVLSATGGVFTAKGLNGSTAAVSGLTGLSVGIDVEDLSVTNGFGLNIAQPAIDTGSLTLYFGIFQPQPTAGAINWAMFSSGMHQLNAGSSTVTPVLITGAAAQSSPLLRLTDVSQLDYINSGDGLTGSEYVGNEQGVDIDFRWEGSTITDLFKIDAGLDIVKTGGGRTVNETRYTSVDSISITDDLVWGDTDGGSYTLTLHDGAGGNRHIITNSGSSGNALTVAADGSDTIDGGATLALYDGETATIYFNSTDNEWRP